MSGLSYREEVEALSPSLYWPLDATDGATDQSGNGRNGTASGPTIGGHSATYAPLTGEPQSCTDFDGVDDTVTSTYSPFTNGTTRTFMGWAYRDTNSAYNGLVGGLGLYPNRTAIALSPSSNELGFYPGTAGRTWTTAWSGNGVWVFWAVVYEEAADLVTLYINGAIVTTQLFAGAPYPASGNFQVSTENPFDGKQAHVAVFESGLTAGNISDIYAGRLVAPPAPPTPTTIIPDIVSAPALR